MTLEWHLVYATLNAIISLGTVTIIQSSTIRGRDQVGTIITLYDNPRDLQTSVKRMDTLKVI